MYTEYWVEEVDGFGQPWRATRCGTLAAARDMAAVLESSGRTAIVYESHYSRGIDCPDCGAGVGASCADNCPAVAW